MSGTEPNCARDITAAETVPLQLRVDRVADRPGQSTDTLYCTDIEGTALRVSVDGSPVPDSARETGGWYRFDGLRRSGESGSELATSSGSGVERIDAPEQRAHPPLAELEDPWLLQFGASTEQIAVTVQPRPTDSVERISPDDPDTFEIGAACLAYGDGTDTAVYHREEPDPEDERLLLEHVVDALTAADGATLLTGGAGHPPLELLETRLAVTTDNGASRMLDGCFHADLDRVTDRAGVDTLGEVARQMGVEHSPVRLDSYDIGVEPASWRADWDIGATRLTDVSDPRMTDRDYAYLVELHLGEADESVTLPALSRCLKSYASAELSLLCALGGDEAVDRLGCPQLGGRTAGGA